MPKKVMGGCFGGRRSVVKPRDRWENAVRSDAIRKWTAAERERQVWMKEIG
jgi:hypothetical protein